MDAQIIWICLFVVCLQMGLSIADSTDCNGINTYTYYIRSSDYYNWYISLNDYWWYNITFWGGYLQIPSKENVGTKCQRDWGTLIALKDKQPDISTISDDIVTLPACGLNQNGKCEEDIIVEMRKCHGHLFYRFPEQSFYRWDLYICFDRIYSNSDCNDSEHVYQPVNENGRFINFEFDDIKNGWMNAFVNGKQFLPPSKDDEDEVIYECLPYQYGYILQEPIPNVLSETPVRLSMCSVGAVYGDYETDTCSEIYIYTRLCNGQLQFDMSFFTTCSDCICLVYRNNVKVKPEIGHKILNTEDNDKLRKVYSPFLQYRCEFDILDGVTYITKWYINGTFQVQMGPSSNQDELLFKEDFLSALGPGYEVQCGVITVNGNESPEALSDAFYAGLKVKDDSITLSKSGFSTVDIEQTIPKGCYHADDEEPNCEERITFEDDSSVPDMCTGKLRVQNIADVGNPFVTIKSLKKDEQWTSTTHRIMLTTADSTYDDATKFDLQVYVTDTTGHDKRRSVRSETIGAIHVTVTDNYRHRNKRCYSHVDPHMRTVDGLNYEAQEEGNYTLYRNKKYQTEVVKFYIN